MRDQKSAVQGPLRVLIIEDSDDDAALEIRALERAGYAVVHEQVDTGAAMDAALVHASWDIILSDHSMPRFSATAALHLLQAHGLDVPFLLVSGCIGEQEAVSLLKGGAEDYVQKDSLSTLAPAVDRALRAARTRRERCQAEDALRASEARKQAMLDASLDAIVSMDHEGHIVEWSRAAEAIFGYRREEVIGAPLVERLIPPAQRDAHAMGLRRYLATGEDRILGRRMEMTALRADGSVIPVELTVMRLTAPGPPVFTGYIRDLSERKRSEQEQALLSAIVESAEDAIVAKTLDGIITSWNPAAERMYGYTADEAIGRPSTMLSPESRADEALWIMDLVRRGERIQHHETVRRRKDGACIDVALTFWPIVNASGRIIGASSICRDIREQKRAEAALRESEERLRLATDAAKVGLWFWDVVQNQIEWSLACWELFGRTPGSALTYEMFLGYVHPDDAARVHAAVVAAHDGGRDYVVEARIVRPSGEIRWMSTRGRVFRDEQGKPVRMMGVVIDITDHVRADLERKGLLESERAARGAMERHLQLKDEFLATLSHELRTPLTAILGWTRILRARPEAAAVEPQLAIIERNTRLQVQMITDLLDMNRIVSGKLRINARSVIVAHVVTAAVDTMQPAADAKGIVLTWGVSDDATMVRGDADRLQQVFWNLLSNAVKFTPREGRITITQASVGSSVEVRVTDSGEGISPDFLPHLFERFRQADASTTRRHGGLGLGLAIAQELVELHGGTVRAESAGLGAGTTFTVTLPISAGLDEPAAAETDERSVPSMELDEPSLVSLRGVKVLVVDDQEDARDLVDRLLKEHDAEVVTAASALEALEALERARPDVLVSDIGMPEIDGYELIRRVRALAPERGGAVPAVALTAFVRREDQEHAREEGYQAHLTKPIEYTRLITTVAALATGRFG